MTSIRAAFVIPGDLALPTGGYAYDRHVLARAASRGVDLQHVALPGTYPAPDDATLRETALIVGAQPPDAVLLIDGLAFGAMPEAMVQSFPQKIVALVHHPLCLETGLSEARQTALRESEIAALRHARETVVTSAETGRIVERDFGVPGSRVTVAEPGTVRVSRSPGTGSRLQLLAVGSIVPRKAYGVLLDALAAIEGVPDWQLTIVGKPFDLAEFSRVTQTIAHRALHDRVRVVTDADDAALEAYYAAADVFVLPSVYEGYGMVLTEALVRGLPIVTTSGVAAAMAYPHVVQIVQTRNPSALRDALRMVMSDATLRRRMADASWAAGQMLPTWDDTTRIIATVLKRVAA